MSEHIKGNHIRPATDQILTCGAGQEFLARTAYVRNIPVIIFVSTEPWNYESGIVVGETPVHEEYLPHDKGTFTIRCDACPLTDGCTVTIYTRQSKKPRSDTEALPDVSGDT